MAKQNLLSSTIGKKYAMALSAFFLMIFLIMHLAINFTSIFSESMFNQLSHFMGTNPVIQIFMQPVLIIGVVFHFVMGFILQVKNNQARNVKYKMYKGSANSTWMSRNMIITGAVILAFLVLHFIDFWIPEMSTKYLNGDMSGMHNGEFRYYDELVHKFQHPLRVFFYVVSFVLLALHLLHGFWSAFQSIGANSPKWMPLVKKIGNAYAVLIPLGFIIVALYHFFAH